MYGQNQQALDQLSVRLIGMANINIQFVVLVAHSKQFKAKISWFALFSTLLVACSNDHVLRSSDFHADNDRQTDGQNDHLTLAHVRRVTSCK